MLELRKAGVVAKVVEQRKLQPNPDRTALFDGAGKPFHGLILFLKPAVNAREKHGADVFALGTLVKLLEE